MTLSVKMSGNVKVAYMSPTLKKNWTSIKQFTNHHNLNVTNVTRNLEEQQDLKNIKLILTVQKYQNFHALIAHKYLELLIAGVLI